MKTLESLFAQKADVEKQIADLRNQGRLDAIEKARSLVAEFGLTPDDVFGGARKKPGKGSLAGTKVAPRYRDPETGKTWTGRGVAPKWIAGKDRDAFLIK
jgi:DNA-binding protein H-NS